MRRRKLSKEEWWHKFQQTMEQHNTTDQDAIEKINALAEKKHFEDRIIVTQDKQALYVTHNPETGEWEVKKHAEYNEDKPEKWKEGNNGMRIVGNYAKGLVKVAVAGAVMFGLGASAYSLVKNGGVNFSQINETITHLLGFDLFGGMKTRFLSWVPDSIKDSVYSMSSLTIAPPAVQETDVYFKNLYTTPLEKYNALPDDESKRLYLENANNRKNIHDVFAEGAKKGATGAQNFINFFSSEHERLLKDKTKEEVDKMNEQILKPQTNKQEMQKLKAGGFSFSDALYYGKLGIKTAVVAPRLAAAYSSGGLSEMGWAAGTLALSYYFDL